MYHLNEARELQSRNQRKVIALFSIYIFAIAIATVYIMVFTDYFALYKALNFLPVVLILIAVKQTKIYLFLQPKEFCGKIKHLNVEIELYKKYLSGNAGANYIAEKRKILKKRFKYNKNYKDLKVGDSVALLCFVDEPVILK